MALACKSFFLVVMQFSPDPAPASFQPSCKYKHQCGGTLQDSGLNVSVTYERYGAPFPEGTVFFLEGAFAMLGGISMIFADTADDINCPRPTSSIFIPFKPRLWFEGVVTQGETFTETDGTRSLVMDVFIDGPLPATVRCRFLTSRHLLSALPIVYKRHKLTIVGDICGWSDHDLVDVDVCNINCTRYSKHAEFVEVIWYPEHTDSASSDSKFIGTATSNALVPLQQTVPRMLENVGASRLLETVGAPRMLETVGAIAAPAGDMKTQVRHTTDPLSRVWAGAVESTSKGLPFKIYGWRPPKNEDRAISMDMEWPKMYKPVSF